MKKFITVIAIALVFVLITCGCSNINDGVDYGKAPKGLEGVWHTTEDLNFSGFGTESNVSFEMEIDHNSMRIVENYTVTRIEFDHDAEYHSEYLDYVFDDSTEAFNMLSYEDWMAANYPEVETVEVTNHLKAVVWYGTYTSVDSNSNLAHWTSENLDVNEEESVNYIFGYDTDFASADFTYKNGQIVYECSNNGVIYEFVFER